MKCKKVRKSLTFLLVWVLILSVCGSTAGIVRAQEGEQSLYGANLEHSEASGSMVIEETWEEEAMVYAVERSGIRSIYKGLVKDASEVEGIEGIP